MSHDKRGIPGAAMARLGNPRGAPMFVIHASFDGDSASNPTILDGAQSPFRVMDVVVHCTETNGSGTVRVDRDGSAITDAITCDTDTNVTRAGTVDDAQYKFSKGDPMELTITNSAAGEIYIVCVQDSGE